MVTIDLMEFEKLESRVARLTASLESVQSAIKVLQTNYLGRVKRVHEGL